MQDIDQDEQVFSEDKNLLNAVNVNRPSLSVKEIRKSDKLTDFHKIGMRKTPIYEISLMYENLIKNLLINKRNLKVPLFIDFISHKRRRHHFVEYCGYQFMKKYSSTHSKAFHTRQNENVLESYKELMYLVEHSHQRTQSPSLNVEQVTKKNKI
jgi:hypothetical protein